MKLGGIEVGAKPRPYSTSRFSKYRNDLDSHIFGAVSGNHTF